MDNLNRVRTSSYPELAASSTSNVEDYSLEGISTNVKLLLKLIQDHQDASGRANDDRRAQRVAGMMTVLDDIKSRIEKSQCAGKRRVLPQLRRCNTDLRPIGGAPGDKKSHEPMDEKERMRRQFHASLAAQKSLALMCSSLGKEKEIIASELARKVNEVNEMDELVNDLKAQNETLLTKLQENVAEQEKGYGSVGAQGNVALQERNRELSEQLLMSIDSYRSLKRKYKKVKEENREVQETLKEIGMEIAEKLDGIRSFKRRMTSGNNQTMDIEEHILVLEQMFEQFNMKVSRHVTGTRFC